MQKIRTGYDGDDVDVEDDDDDEGEHMKIFSTKAYTRSNISHYFLDCCLHYIRTANNNTMHRIERILLLTIYFVAYSSICV